jgi:hypothetical protein
MVTIEMRPEATISTIALQLTTQHRSVYGLVSQRTALGADIVRVTSCRLSSLLKNVSAVIQKPGYQLRSLAILCCYIYKALKV